MSDECCDLVVITDVETLVITDEALPTLTMIEETQLIEVFDEIVDLLVITDVETLILSDCGIQGPPGPPGPAGSGSVVQVVAGETILPFHAVMVGPDGLGYLPDRDSLSDAFFVLGVATSAALAGEALGVATGGFLDGPASWTPGPLYVGDDGVLTADLGLGAYDFEIAVAVTTSRLVIRPQPPIYTV